MTEKNLILSTLKLATEKDNPGMPKCLCYTEEQAEAFEREQLERVGRETLEVLEGKE